MRAQRGKSWSWVRRCSKRRDFRGLLWVEMRRSKLQLRQDLKKVILGSGGGLGVVKVDWDN